jgi:hypothetical protein
MAATKPVRVGKRTYPTHAAVARAHRVPYPRYYQRVKAGMSPTEALKAPLHNGRTYGEVTFQGKKYRSLPALCDYLGLSYQGVLSRMRAGCTVKEAVMRSRYF